MARSISKVSFIYLASNLLCAAIPFLLLPVLTKYLTPEQYGQIAVFQTLIAALGSIVGLNVGGASGLKYYETFSESDLLKKYITSCVQILMFSVIIVWLFILLFENLLLSLLEINSYSFLYAALLVTCMQTFIQIRLSQWQVRSEAEKYGLMQLGQSLFNIVSSLLLIIIIGMGAEGRIVSIVIASTVFCIISIILLKRDNLLGFFSWQPSLIKEILKFGVPLIPHSLGIFLITAADRFIINTELGLKSTGIYLLAVQLVSVMWLVFDAVNNAYVPWLFERLNRNQLIEKQQVVRYTYYYCVLLLIPVGIAFLIGPKVVVILAGPAYADAGNIIGLLAIGQAFGGMYLMVTNYIFYSKKTGALSIITIFSGLFNIILLMLTIRWLGLQGAAISFCLANAIRFLATWWFAQRCYSMPWFNCYPSRN